jgi:hypothetical protein
MPSAYQETPLLSKGETAEKQKGPLRLWPTQETEIIKLPCAFHNAIG